MGAVVAIPRGRWQAPPAPTPEQRARWERITAAILAELAARRAAAEREEG